MARRHLTERQREQIRRTQEQRWRRAAERAARQVDALDSSGLGAEQPGLVVANYGPALIVESSPGRWYRCAVRQHLGTLVCGDRVLWQQAGTGEGVVIALEERRSLLSRPDYSGRPRPIAANLDQLAVVIAPQPPPQDFMIDSYLVAGAGIGVEPLLVINKIDLLDAAAVAEWEARLAPYHRIGYPLLFASTRTAHGLDALRDHLKGRTSILVGQSGVGKSSLIKALLPDLDIRIQALSAATGLGTHATSTATLYHLPDGGDLIDSPGVRGFTLGTLDPAVLEQGFVEFRPYLGQCRFFDCSHTVEPGCALLAAVERGDIDPRRLQSYHQLKRRLRPG
ncbi:MAG: small ribosomal subunit biogenesis GTPase RsgA [Candidatus Competibacteraceae bacterium]